MEKRCVLDEMRFCVDCGECLRCDLDAEKVCDNCMCCVQKSNADYLAIEIDEVFAGTSPDGEDAPGPNASGSGAAARKSGLGRAVRPRKIRPGGCV